MPSSVSTSDETYLGWGAQQAVDDVQYEFKSVKRSSIIIPYLCCTGFTIDLPLRTARNAACCRSKGALPRFP